MAHVARRAGALRGIPGLDARLTGSIAALARDRLAPIEDWHIVGDTGEPGFRAYPGAAIRYEHGDSPVRFFRDTSGMVHLAGQLVRVGTPRQLSELSVSYPPFALPPGYRPERAPGQFRYSTLATVLRSDEYIDSDYDAGVVAVSSRGHYDPDGLSVYMPSLLISGGLLAGGVGLGFGGSDALMPGDATWLDGIRFLADPAEIPPVSGA